MENVCEYSLRQSTAWLGDLEKYLAAVKIAYFKARKFNVVDVSVGCAQIILCGVYLTSTMTIMQVPL